MTTTEAIKLDNGCAEGIMVPALAGEGHATLLVIRCARGFLMCGYLSLEKAEQLGDAAVRVAGSSFDEILANKITGMTPAAAALGIAPEMTGREAAEILNQQ